ncbi:MAG: hypothetical protein CMJ81_07065 [Planctomycetaceae bacterium]|nr:hypothetical protein [Planctomycetaceae bacterium]MBP61214.1 hypothetical protein [Planctomycetaceae bacterium]
MTNADKEQTQEEKKKEPKKDVEIDRPKIDPSDENTNLYYAKPGHWVSVTQKMKANNFDFNGEIQSTTVDHQRDPVPLERTSYVMQGARPAALPKGQTKHFETVYFVPDSEIKRPALLSALRSKSGRRLIREETELATLMQPFHFFFVVLARQAETYGYLKTGKQSIQPLDDELELDGRNVHYRVVLPSDTQRVSLPGHELTWTSIAYLLWDDFESDSIRSDQVQALLDWLHWGGQMIVSGPQSLDTLKGSFLADYLPVTSKKTRQLKAESFAEMNKYWTIATSSKESNHLQVLADQPINGLMFELKEEGRYVPHTGELVAERRVGRGRVVVTAFPLAQRQVVNWVCFDNFFNGCLLRHPARRFTQTADGGLYSTWARYPNMRDDPRLLSNLRYFSRDARSSDGGSVQGDPDRGHLSHPKSGIAGWNDFSAVADAARASLRRAAGISVPQKDFVLMILLAYLVILVPVNWGLFHALGRLEWAWVAAPCIAIFCAVIVVKLAQLDIGFARSRTEIAVLEMQPDYSRAHLTRYTALYSSLSTTYSVEFEDNSSLVLPFAMDKEFKMVVSQNHDTVYYHRGTTAKLSGFRVDSNSTGLLHSEQLLDLGGGVRLTKPQDRHPVITNGSELTIQDAAVLRRREGGQFQVAWVGNLAAADARSLTFASPAEKGQLLAEWESSPAFSETAAGDSLSLSRLLKVAQSEVQFQPGDVRLIGWTDAQLPGMEINPRSSQQTMRTLIVAHVRYGVFADPKCDVNLPPDIGQSDEELPSFSLN